MVAVAACASFALVTGTGTAAAAADPTTPAIVEGESKFADSGQSLGMSSLQAAASTKVPKSPNFGPAIDDYAPSDSQDTCPKPLIEQPGPVALRKLLNETYDLNNTGNITRACNVGDTSEHKEGRALDYMLDATNSSQRNIGDTVADWMLATDNHGNKHAVARRLGIQYIIWNRKIWSSSRASEGWRSYLGTNPHTDHMHFSFSWPGARKQTTWWTAALPPAPAPAVPSRIGVLTTDGQALVKEGSLTTSWVNEYGNVQQVLVDGDRVGVLTTDGQALVKDGGLGAAWINQYSGVKQLALAGNRIGVLTTDGQALVKDGGLGAAWVNQYSNVQQLALAGDRIGVLTTDGQALVKDGGLGAAWINQYSGVRALALSANRIGVLTTDGQALVKDGGLGAAWVNQYSNVQQLALAGDRIGVLTVDGVALVKDGGLGAVWVNQYSNVQQLALAGDRIGVLTVDGVALVKDGGLGAVWVNQYSGVRQLTLS